MAHYAFLDSNNIVTEVIPGIDETELIEGKTQRFGTVSFEIKSAFALHTTVTSARTTQVSDSVTTRSVTLLSRPSLMRLGCWLKKLAQWEAPVPYPDDGLMYSWNEEIIDWEATSFEAVN